MSSEKQKEYFPEIGNIIYDPNAGPENTLVFKHYNAKEKIRGRTMEEWLRFSVCFWHTFKGTGSDPFGEATLKRDWDDGTANLDNAKRRLEVAFEFFSKLGIKYWTFHDRDISPEGKNLKETNKYFDEMAVLVEKLQMKTGIKLLWLTCNLFNHSRYMHGAATSCNAKVTAFAAAQVKKGLDIAKKLGAENVVFWGGREGYQTLLNTKIKLELDHMGEFFKMVVAYKEKIGYNGQLLIEPKPKEPTKHQYDYDAQSVMAFLLEYDLKSHFKLNIEPNHTTLAGHCYEHDVVYSSAYNMLGSIDANTGSPDLGWDTDQFPMNIRDATMVMKTVLEQGGLNPGGLNFDAKVRRESTEPKDMFIAHIGAMDCFARGLRNADKIVNNGVIRKAVQSRYSSWNSDIGLQISSGKCTLEECEEFIHREGDPQQPESGKQEHFESMLNHYL